MEVLASNETPLELNDYLINSDKLLANVTITINVGSMNYLLVGNLTLN
jgi:hypothetical protein